jgi:hypothetical protein
MHLSLHRAPMRIPTCQDFVVHDSLDECIACEHFLGRSLEEAEALFRENSLYYLEDLMFMGACAFRFYIQAVGRFIQSEAAAGDSDVISGFVGLLEHRLEEAKEMRLVAEQLASICGFILQRYGRFDLSPEVYGDVRPRLRALQKALSSKR